MNFENFGRLIDSFTGGETNFRFAEVGQMMDAASGNNNQNYNQAYNNNGMMQRPGYEFQYRVGPLPQPIGLHYFAVGARPLNFTGGNVVGSSGALHVCFLLDNDIFEYGLPEFGKNYVRRRNVGKTINFDWNYHGDRSGSTYSTPDQLENAIVQSGKWTGDQYNFCYYGGDPSHNCHDFVSFCLRFCAGNCGIARKGVNLL